MLRTSLLHYSFGYHVWFVGLNLEDPIIPFHPDVVNCSCNAHSNDSGCCSFSSCISVGPLKLLLSSASWSLVIPCQHNSCVHMSYVFRVITSKKKMFT
uniref:Uncharacterized protein n=1 Tax=Solanum tuberosum TaxID=4113 RepID=M1BDF6_SOLTU